MTAALNLGVETTYYRLDTKRQEKTMRVNPDYVTNLVGSLDQVTASEQTLTDELSTGVRVNSLSDDPAAAGEMFCSPPS